MGGTFFLALYVLTVLPQGAVLLLTVVSATALAVVAAVRRLRQSEMLPIIPAAVLSACILVQVYTAAVFRPIADLDGKTVQITASLADLPQTHGDSFYYELRTRSVDGAPMRCRIGLWSSTDIELTPRQTVSLTAQLHAADAPDSTGVWLRVDKYESLSVTDTRPDFFARMLEMRRYTIDTLMQAVPGTCGAVLAAMVTGDTSHIPADVYAHLRNCGIVHIFAVSGFHLSVFSMLLYRFLERRRLPRWASILPSVVPVLFFMAVTGFSYSCVRAGIMLLMLLFGRLFFWQSDSLNSLGTSLLVIGFIQPFCAADVGLQLSVLGALGVILSTPLADRVTQKIRMRPVLLQKAVCAVVSVLCVSAGIHLMTLYVISAHFDTVSLISPLANAAILFAAQWAMIGAAVSVLLSAVAPLHFLFRAAAFLSGVLARYCIVVSDFLGSLFFSAVRADRMTLCFWTAGTLLVIGISLLLPLSVIRRAATCAAVSIGILVGCMGFHAWSVRDSVFVTLPDIGNRSAVLVQSRGETALIGCGGFGTARRIGQWTDEIGLLVLPRTAASECGGAVDLIRTVPCRRIWVPARVPATEGTFFFASPEVRETGTQRVGAVELQYRGGENAAVYLSVHDKTVLVLFSPGCDLSQIPSAWQSADIVCARSDLPPAMEADKIGLILLSRSAAQGDPLPKAIRESGALAASTADRGDLRLRIDPDGTVGFES